MIVEKDLRAKGRLDDTESDTPAWKAGLSDAQQMYVLRESGFEDALHDSSIDVDIPRADLARFKREAKQAERNLKRLR